MVRMIMRFQTNDIVDHSAKYKDVSVLLICMVSEFMAAK